MKKALRSLALLIASIALFATPASAFTLEPMSALLAPSGAGSVGTFRIRNDGSSRIAIRLSVMTRSVGEDGKEVNGPTNAFVVYPARVLVEPGSTAAAKVQWKGPANLEAEQCFRLIAEEVNIDSAPDSSSGIKMKFRYIASLYVGKTSFAPKLDAKVTGAAGPNGEKGFLVSIANSGTRHVVAMKIALTLKEPADSPLSFANEDLGSLNAANYLPGSSRNLFIANDGAEVGKSYDAVLQFESEY
jgi:P pilus assembly protein, chaperone PapD